MRLLRCARNDEKGRLALTPRSSLRGQFHRTKQSRENKGRYFCTSCHTKRAAIFAERLNETVIRPVPHRQIVFTVPKLLRVYFRNDRRLLGDLCRVAAGVITEGIRALLGKTQLTPGIVICVQTYGNFVKGRPFGPPTCP